MSPKLITKGHLHLTVLPQTWDRPSKRSDCLTAKQHGDKLLEEWLQRNPDASIEMAPVFKTEDGINCERPCPWFGCVHHLGTMVHSQSGELRVHPKIDETDPDPASLPGSCALDMAEEGTSSFERIGALIGTTQEYAVRLYAAGVRRAQLAGKDGG